jgi:hypothetical protein
VVYVRRRPSSTGALPERAVATAVRRHADAAGVELEDAVAVWEDLWWSYLCRDARCCPPEGNRLPDPSTLAIVAALVAEGVAPAPSRQALAASLDPAPEGAGPELAAAIARRRAEVGAAPGALTRARTMAALDRLLLLGAGAGPPDDPSDVDDLADLLVGLADAVARDAAFCVVADSDPDASTELLRRAVRVSPIDCVAPVATVLALAAYLDGDGALANIALDRALAAEPRYPMALLLLEALSRGAHPSQLRQMVDDIRAEVMPTTAS